ncbi:hypothetical protein BB561_000927 [Smittium simulii]|uniref:rRNA adenine N(6)-methyltransferase n=1 Tax=Smittium simulii TaxID=133385 RepID=A0A2T9YWY3_9FUNG|nr:hypothetical protein BB561_000927 [Smittium simulii]
MSLKLLPLPKVADLLKLYNISAKSRLSQNFILDKNTTDTIVSKADLNPKNSLVVEVGPGLLSRSILEIGAENLVSVENDKRFQPLLQQLEDASNNRFTPIYDDILTIDHNKILEVVKDKEIESVHLIGNLPFNISTKLLSDWLKMMHKQEGVFKLPNLKMTLMFQFEVGQRIAAGASNKYRGRLSVMSQSLCSTKEVYVVKAVVVNFKKMWNPSYLEFFEQAGIPMYYRPQDITSEQMCKLAKVMEDGNVNFIELDNKNFDKYVADRSVL